MLRHVIRTPSDAARPDLLTGLQLRGGMMDGWEGRGMLEIRTASRAVIYQCCFPVEGFIATHAVIQPASAATRCS